MPSVESSADCKDAPPPKVPRIDNQTIHQTLNYDVLIYLFKYLSVKTLRVCAQVCRCWRQAAYDPAFWCKSAPLYENFSDLNVDTAKSLKERNIKTVKLGVIESDEAELATMFSNLSQHAEIENLHLVGLLTVHNITRHLPASFPSLIRLNLNQSTQGIVTEDGFRRLLQPLVNLEQLTISEYYGWKYKNKGKIVSEEQPSFDYFEVIFTCLPKLKALDVSILGTTDGSIYFEETTETPVPNILQLALFDVEPIDCRKVIEKASRKFPNLKHLDLGISNHSGQDMDQVDVDFKCLESLYMNQTSSQIMIPYTLDWICGGCKSLKALDVSVYSPYFGCVMENGDIAGVLESCANTLRVINLSGHGTTLRIWNETAPQLVNLEVLVLGVFEKDESDSSNRSSDNDSDNTSDGDHDNDRINRKTYAEVKAAFIDNIRSHMPNLVSLLGLLITETEYDSLPTVKYISKEDHLDSCSWKSYIKTRSDRHPLSTKRVGSDLDWLDVMKDTPEWVEATGLKYFTLPDYIDIEKA